MSTRIPTPNPPRELARRLNGGIEVTLYWNADDNSTSIEVRQPATEETLTFAVARERALDAFYHPFAHLAAPQPSSSSQHHGGTSGKSDATRRSRTRS